MTRLKLLLTVVAGGLLVIGGMQTYTFLRNLRPTTYTVESYLEKRPPEKWLHFTGGEMDMMEMSYSSFLGIGSASELYIPLRPNGAKESGPDRILVKTKDPALLQFAEEIRGAKTDAQRAGLIKRRDHDVLLHRDVEGLILEGINLKDSEVRKIRKVNPDLPDDFIILEEGKRPDIGDVFMFGVGIVLSAFLGLSYYKSWNAPKGGPPPPPGFPPMPGGMSVPPPPPN